ncbi:helix-turn-helix domain-containing protein [Actinocorallia sp. API 0066]|uniref:helix-turn-helix domain-containing protein n=1 Tax=Actinocorallia sp. API 0066 TaxID=2896846 RepID=UPI001E602586|nr:helix-turn-helix domain-containing protein [Actinocorallia sp. API 0066]MCD0449324.1 helix-turn-helix domain-containing protein [Actinocorallia sp. API 0066]
MEIRNLPELVQAIMKDKGWTQADLGKAWGRTEAWVSLVLDGKQDIRFNQLSDMLGRIGYELVIRRKPDGRQ